MEHLTREEKITALLLLIVQQWTEQIEKRNVDVSKSTLREAFHTFIHNFGRCKRCGQDLNSERLLASPHVQICMRCHNEALGIPTRNTIFTNLGHNFQQASFHHCQVTHSQDRFEQQVALV